VSLTSKQEGLLEGLRGRKIQLGTAVRERTAWVPKLSELRCEREPNFRLFEGGVNDWRISTKTISRTLVAEESGSKGCAKTVFCCDIIDRLSSEDECVRCFKGL
jgi:hypothetical protein